MNIENPEFQDAAKRCALTARCMTLGLATPLKNIDVHPVSSILAPLHFHVQKTQKLQTSCSTKFPVFVAFSQIQEKEHAHNFMPS